MNSTTDITVLVSSLSKKVPLIKSIRKSFQDSKLTGKIIGTDKTSEVIGRYFVDRFEYFSGLDDLNIGEFITECKKYDVKAIIPTRNGELEFYATHRDQLAQNEIFCMVSSLKSIKKCVDKLAFYNELKSNFPIIQTSLLVDFDSSRYVVKERYGAGSIDIGLNLSREDAIEYAKQLHDPIYQPYILGPEFSIDLFINRAGEVLGTIARKRDVVVKGESQITQSIKYPDLEKLCTEMARKIEFIWPCHFSSHPRE